MTLLLILFGVFIIMAGLLMVIRPSVFIDYLASKSDKVWIYVLAIVVRIVLGWLLIQQSIYSKFPAVIEVLGWISLVAAFSLLFIGQSRFTRLMDWLMGKLHPYARFAGLVALAFGAFLVYAFV